MRNAAWPSRSRAQSSINAAHNAPTQAHTLGAGRPGHRAVVSEAQTSVAAATGGLADLAARGDSGRAAQLLDDVPRGDTVRCAGSFCLIAKCQARSASCPRVARAAFVVTMPSALRTYLMLPTYQ